MRHGSTALHMVRGAVWQWTCRDLLGSCSWVGTAVRIVWLRQKNRCPGWFLPTVLQMHPRIHGASTDCIPYIQHNQSFTRPVCLKTSDHRRCTSRIVGWSTPVCGKINFTLGTKAPFKFVTFVSSNIMVKFHAATLGIKPCSSMVWLFYSVNIMKNILVSW